VHLAVSTVCPDDLVGSFIVLLTKHVYLEKLEYSKKALQLEH